MVLQGHFPDDLAASNAKAIAIGPDTRMIFRTNYPYNKDRLKKVLCRVRNVDSTAPIQVGVCGIRDEAYVQPDGEYGLRCTRLSLMVH